MQAWWRITYRIFVGVCNSHHVDARRTLGTNPNHVALLWAEFWIGSTYLLGSPRHTQKKRNARGGCVYGGEYVEVWSFLFVDLSRLQRRRVSGS